MRSGGSYVRKDGKRTLAERTAPPEDGVFAARDGQGNRLTPAAETSAPAEAAAPGENDVIQAIVAVLPKLKKPDFNKDGTPKVAAVERELGRDVTDESVEYAFQTWTAGKDEKE